ncbi:hypothetical protein H0H92_000422 [Tricholoma furcatifolium]|nr:hypothetical protein H0H92_000422 [Tricholoma furcatifolium]
MAVRQARRTQKVTAERNQPVERKQVKTRKLTARRKQTVKRKQVTEAVDKELATTQEEATPQKKKPRKYLSAQERQKLLEEDLYAEEVDPLFVKCLGCKQVLQLEKPGPYYPFNWTKHRDGKCSQIPNKGTSQREWVSRVELVIPSSSSEVGLIQVDFLLAVQRYEGNLTEFTYSILQKELYHID